eukprot:4692005-Lingulodinium_polyedra.AAC.1
MRDGDTAASRQSIGTSETGPSESSTRFWTLRPLGLLPVSRPRGTRSSWPQSSQRSRLPCSSS